MPDAILRTVYLQQIRSVQDTTACWYFLHALEAEPSVGASPECSELQAALMIRREEAGVDQSFYYMAASSRISTTRLNAA